MLLLMRIAIIGLILFIASLKTLGPSPSNPVAFDRSKALMYDCICSLRCLCSILLDFSFTVKVAPRECVIRTGQP